MASTQHTKKNDPADAPPPPPGPVKAAIGYALGALVGLLILWVAAGLLRKPQKRFLDELPHLTVLAEVQDLRSTETRRQLAAFERSLEGLGLAVQGPITSPVLVPGARVGDMPLAIPLDKLTPEQFDEAAKYFGVGGWIAPRVISPDLRSVVFRACPKQGESFKPDHERRLAGLMGDPLFKDLTLTAYSHALRIEEPAARAKTNVVFGVQTAIVLGYNDAKIAGSPAFQLDLLKSVEDYRSKAKGPRSVVCDGSYLHYAAAVRLHQASLKSEDAGSADPFALLQLASDSGIRLLSARDGSFTRIEVTTDAEGPQNNAIGFDVVANMKRPAGLSGPFRFDRDTKH